VVITVFSINNQLVFTSTHHDIIRKYSIHLENNFLVSEWARFCTFMADQETERKRIFIVTHNFLIFWFGRSFLEVSCFFWVEDELLSPTRFLWKDWSSCISPTWSFCHVYGFYMVLCLYMNCLQLARIRFSS